MGIIDILRTSMNFVEGVYKFFCLNKKSHLTTEMAFE